MEDLKYIQEIDQEDSVLSFDRDKFFTILKRLFPWITLLFIIAVLSAYLVIRYTKPLYESKSVLKLDIKSEASFLGLNNIDEDQSYNNLLSEIELLKSSLFFNKIIDAVELDVSIYTIGNILVDERYPNAPFDVQYTIYDPDVYDIPFKVEIINKEKFNLSYTLKGIDENNDFLFDQPVKTEHFDFILTCTSDYDSQASDAQYFFTVNSRHSQLNYIEENFSVQPLKLNTNTIEISFKDFNKQKARDLVNAIDTIYLQYTKEEKTKANSQKIEFLNQQLASTEERLSNFEDYFENFIVKNKTIDLQDNLSETIQLLNRIDSQRYHLEFNLSRMIDLKSELDSGEQINLGINDYRILPASVREEINNLNELLEHSESILLSYNKNTQAYRLRTREIAIIYDRIHTFIDEYISDIRNQIRELSIRKSKLERNFVELPSKNTEYSKSQRYYSLYEEFYLSLMQRKAEFQLAMAGTVTDFKILSSANLPVQPLKPKQGLAYGVGLASWFMLTFFIVGIGYLSFNKITGIQEVERQTDIPILGTIPDYSKEKLLHAKLVVDENEHTAVGEAFRSLRTNMQFIMAGKGSKIVSISSTVSGEGKTFIGVNLAAIYAKSGKKVLMMDLDLRKPKLNRIFKNINVDIGISTILIGKHTLKDCINRTGISNLDILMAGPIPPNPSELIMSPQMSAILEEMKQEYDLIFIDTPPTGIVTDGVLVMKMADIQLYVLRVDYSRSQFIEYTLKNNTIHKFPHLYFVLNSVRSGRGLHYGYGYGSGYYKERKKNYLSRFLGRT